MNTTEYYLSWRGRQSGPFSLEEIEAQLRRGEVSGLHLIHHGGAWIPLEEFLATNKPLPVAPPPPMPAPPSPVDDAMEDRLAEIEAALLRRSTAAPVMPAVSLPPPPVQQWYPPVQQWYPPVAIPRGPRQTSGTAVVAFIFSLICNFFYLIAPPIGEIIGFVMWLLSIIFGHTSLSDCNRNPELVGGGLALAALIISYLSLFIGLVLALAY